MRAMARIPKCTLPAWDFHYCCDFSRQANFCGGWKMRICAVLWYVPITEILEYSSTWNCVKMNTACCPFILFFLFVLVKWPNFMETGLYTMEVGKHLGKREKQKKYCAKRKECRKVYKSSKETQRRAWNHQVCKLPMFVLTVEKHAFVSIKDTIRPQHMQLLAFFSSCEN